MKKIIIIAALALLAGCTTGSRTLDRVVGLASVSSNVCPTDGSTFAYGSCTLPAGVADPNAHGHVVDTGAPSELYAVCGGLMVAPAGYSLGYVPTNCNPPL